jgi:site-specific DNA recombinase
MRVALYARVSTQRQAQTQTIEQQLARLQAHAQERGWTVTPERIFRDDGYSGAALGRPGLDALRDRAALAEVDVALATAPDRLARKYVHQVLLLEELAGRGCQVVFVERPMSQDPHDQLLLQIRGAVAEYERTLIAERMRRGRLNRLRAGQLLPWVRVPLGYQVDPQRPRDPAGVRVDAAGAALVAQLFAWYLEEGATLLRVAARLLALGIPSPTGKPEWPRATIRGILQNPAYRGTAYGHRTRATTARERHSPLVPIGSGRTHVARPADEWLPVTVPALIDQDTFERAQAKLARNREQARRNNTAHDYLLRALVSCGDCRLSTRARTTWDGRSYYVCAGHQRLTPAARCRARHIPAAQLEALVWADLVALVTAPDQLAAALARAQGGHWVAQELQARLATVAAARTQVARQGERLLAAYLDGVVELPEFERTRQDLRRRDEQLQVQQRQLEASAQQQRDLAGLASGIAAFCATIQAGLAEATFAERRRLVELLIDRVIVTGSDVEIRYVIPTSRDGPHPPFCLLRTDYLAGLPGTIPRGHVAPRRADAQPPEDAVDDLPMVPPLPAPPPVRREQRPEPCPCRVRQFASPRHTCPQLHPIIATDEANRGEDPPSDRPLTGGLFPPRCTRRCSAGIAARRWWPPNPAAARRRCPGGARRGGALAPGRAPRS